MSTFQELVSSEAILKSITEMGFTNPTEIQSKTIPEVMNGKDVLAQAQTGTGKTAAFAIPCLQKLTSDFGIQVLVLSPTRELAQQVGDEFKKLGKYINNAGVAVVVGGKSYAVQIREAKISKILVATPGRLHDLLRSKKIANFAPHMIVLDEADKMLDMGFADDLKAIMKFMPEERQTLLFSATYPPGVRNLADTILAKDAVHMRAESRVETNEDIEQIYCVLRSQDEKEGALLRLLEFYDAGKVIVFCEMKRDADVVGAVLLSKGHKAWILHGDTEQKRREEVMKSFRKCAKGILVATDVAARGLDVNDVTHVINYQIPNYQDSYVHRIGRTGRAGRKGVAITLLLRQDVRTLERWGQRIGVKAKFVEVPSLSSMKNKYLSNLTKKLENVVPEPSVLTAMAEMEEQFGAEDLAARLLELMIKTQNLHGPEMIGMQQRDFVRTDSQRGERARSARSGSTGIRHQRRDGDRFRNERRPFAAEGSEESQGERAGERSEYRSEARGGYRGHSRGENLEEGSRDSESRGESRGGYRRDARGGSRGGPRGGSRGGYRGQPSGGGSRGGPRGGSRSESRSFRD